MQHVGLDGLLKFRARQRLLQNLSEQFAKRAMLRGARCAFCPCRRQADVDSLAHEFEQVLPRKIHEPRAQKNVIMNVVDAEREIRSAEFRRSKAPASSGLDGWAKAAVWVSGIPDT